MMAGGARNVTEVSYVPLLPLTRTPMVLVHVRQPIREIDFLRLWLTQDFVNGHFLPAMNNNLSVMREHGAKVVRRYRHQATEADFWKWLGSYFADHVNTLKHAPPESKASCDSLMACIGKARKKELNAAIRFPEEKVRDTVTQFNSITKAVVHRGSTSTIDETMIAYFGSDAKRLKIWRRIPEKPHAKGMMQWRSVSVFRNSSRRVILGIVALLPSQQCTPVEAASLLIRMLKHDRVGGLHVFLDAGFASEEMFHLLQTDDLTFTICIKSQFTGPFGPLYRLAVDGLAAGHVRTYEHNGHFVQAISKPADADHEDGYITVVVSNGYQAVSQDNVRFRRRGTYEAAVSDFMTTPEHLIFEKFTGHEGETAQERILHATGWDVLAPPPDEQGRQAWTEAALAEMRKDHLHTLARTLPSFARVKLSTKQSLIDFIKVHHPAMGRHASRPRLQHAGPADLQNLYSEIGTADTESAPLIHNFDSHKGAVDHSNEDLYRYIHLTGHRHWESTMVVSILHAMALNAWAAHDEWLCTSALQRDRNLTKKDVHGMRRRFYVFIMTALEQAVAVYK